MIRRFVLTALCLGLFAPSIALAQTLSTFTLDAFSFISFGNKEVVLLPPGSTIQFRFGKPAADGSVSFTIEPEGVSIAPIELRSGGGALHYTFASAASGQVRPKTDQGREVSFTATIRATLIQGDSHRSYDYTIPFTTETATAVNQERRGQVSVTGVRLVEGSWYSQIVGATTNKKDAYPEPGAAVYTVLSGRFDRMP